MVQKLRRNCWLVNHKKVTTDTTEFKHYEDGFQKNLISTSYLDLFNNEIISYIISKAPNYQAISGTLEQAINKTRDCQYRRTFYSDQGWAYQTRIYCSTLKKN